MRVDWGSSSLKFRPVVIGQVLCLTVTAAQNVFWKSCENPAVLGKSNYFEFLDAYMLI